MSLMLTIAEVCERTKTHPRTVRRWADRGLMPRPCKIGGVVRWKASDIDDWIDAGCPKVEAKPCIPAVEKAKVSFTSNSCNEPIARGVRGKNHDEPLCCLPSSLESIEANKGYVNG